jgi:hypothetical protein
MKLSTTLLMVSLATAVACDTTVDRTLDPPVNSDDSADMSTARAATPGTYKLVRRGSEKCLDVNANNNADGTKIHQWTCNGTGAQSFQVEDLGNQRFRLVKSGTNKCVDVASAGTANGTAVQLWTCNGTGAQIFRLEDRNDGTFRLRNTNSDKCVDVASSSSADGATIRIWTCSSTSDAQRWRLVPVDDGGGDGGDDGGGDDGELDWQLANLTNFTSYPEPGSDECEDFSGCQWAGQFAFVNGQQPESWVAAHNIAAVHSRDADEYALKTLRLRHDGRTIDVTVYDMCADRDCNGCCTQNASETGFLIDIESYTMQRFGFGHGIVEWACLDCN